MTRFDRTESKYIEKKINEHVTLPTVGEVVDIDAHTNHDDYDNFECDVVLRGEERQRRAVMLSSTRNGTISVPSIGDTVIVSFLEGDRTRPVITGTLYTDQTRPPLGEPGVYRQKHGSNLYFEADADGSWMRFAHKNDDDGTPNSKIEIDEDGNVNISSGGSGYYTDDDAQSAVGNILSDQFTFDSGAPEINLDPHANTPNAHHDRYSDAESVDAVEAASGIQLSGILALGGNNLTDEGTTIWDSGNGHIPTSVLQNDSITITAGDGLTGGGNVSLGGSITLNVDETTIDHGDLSGLSDDDHTQYPLIDGSRGFTNPVPGVDPNSNQHLATKGYVDAIAQGISYREGVLDEINTPPSSPATGDRYLIDDSPTGDWSGHANEIAEWDGSAWTYYVPDEGDSVWVEDDDILYRFDGTDWIQFGATSHHGALSGLGDDDHNQYLHVDGRRSMTGALDLGSHNLESSGTTIWDDNANHIPEERVEQGSGSGLDADLIDGREVYVQSSEPTSANAGDLWFQTPE